MTIPKASLALLSLVAASLPVSAADVSFTVTPSFVSQYMFRGLRFGGPSFQPSVEMAVESLSVGVFSSFPIADRVRGLSDPEVDPYASYTVPLSERLSAEAGICIYTYPTAKEQDGFFKTTVEPNLGLNYKVGSLTLSPKVYYDAILEGPTLEMNGGYTVPLSKLRTQLDFSASLGTYFWNNSVQRAHPKVENYGSYYLIGVCAPYQITEHITATAGLAFTEGFSNYFDSTGTDRTRNTLAKGRLVGSFALAYRF